jgi:hypothetical protein
LYVPDIESPETDPEYVFACEPTVPKLIVSPFTVPLISRVPDPEDSLIVPLMFDPDCCQSRTKVPWKVPSYCPAGAEREDEPRRERDDPDPFHEYLLLACAASWLDRSFDQGAPVPRRIRPKGIAARSATLRTVVAEPSNRQSTTSSSTMSIEPR